MAVAFDANATISVNGTGTSATNGNLTVGSGANRALIAQLGIATASASITVKWDTAGANQSATVIKSAVNGATAKAELWGLVAPASGNKILTAAWTNSSEFNLNCFAVTGADQTGGVTTFPNSVSATGTGSPTITIASAVGDMTTDSGGSSSNWSAPTKTQTYINNTNGSVVGCGSRAAGAASNVHAWTDGGIWVLVGSSIKAAGGTDTGEWGGCYPPARRMGDTNISY